MEFLKNDKKRESFINGIPIAALSIFVILLITSVSLGKVAYATFMIFILSVYIIIPVNNSYNEGKFKDKSIISNLILQLIVFIAFAISVYIIFLQKNYDLKYTYYIAISSFLIILLPLSYVRIRDAYNKREKKENGKYKNSNLIFKMLYISFLFIYLLSGITDIVLVSKRKMALDNMKMPLSITVNELNEDYYEDLFNSNGSYKSETIEDPKKIEKIVNELKDQKVESIAGTDRLNYERMIENYDDQYILYFEYENIEEKDEEKEIYGNDRIKRGYIDNFLITSNGRSFLKNYGSKKGIIYRVKYYDEIYPIELSEDTIDMIRGYIK